VDGWDENVMIKTTRIALVEVNWVIVERRARKGRIALPHHDNVRHDAIRHNWGKCTRSLMANGPGSQCKLLDGV
jgi:hypothetical protein